MLQVSKMCALYLAQNASADIRRHEIARRCYFVARSMRTHI